MSEFDERWREALRLEEVKRDLGAAAELYAELLEASPRDGAVANALARCLEGAGRFEELLALSFQQLGLEKSEGQRAMLHTRIGNLLIYTAKDEQDREAKEAQSLRHYQDALALAPSFEPPLHGILALCEKKGDARSIADALKLRLKHEARPKERATLLLRLADLTARALKAPATAATLLERALRDYPAGLSARLMLLELLCARGDYARAERFATPPPLTDAHGLHGPQLARLAQMRAHVAKALGRAEEMVECYAVALEATEAPVPLLSELCQAIRALRPELAPPKVLQRLALSASVEVAALCLRAQGLLLLELGRPEAAEQALTSAAALFPGKEACEVLAFFHIRLRHFEWAAQALEAGAFFNAAPDAELACQAAVLLSEHLHRPAEAREMLSRLHRAGAASGESLLAEASLALLEQDPTVAERALRAALPLLEISQQPAWAQLSLELKRLQPDELGEAVWLEEAALRGEERALKQILKGHVAKGDAQAAAAQVGALAPSRQPFAQRLLGDAWRQQGNATLALKSYRQALAAPGNGSDLDAIAGLALVDLRQALAALEAALKAQPFDAEALSLLSALLVASERSGRAERLYQLAQFIRDGVLTQPAPRWALALEPAAHISNPLLAMLAHLRRHVPGPFEAQERMLAASAEQALVPPDTQLLFAQWCQALELEVPEVLVHPQAGAQPWTLGSPNALVVSSALTGPDMPDSALRFSLLRGLITQRMGLHAVSYLASYQLDVSAEALRSAVSPLTHPPGGGDAKEQLAAALSLPVADAEKALREAATLPWAHAVEPLSARHQWEEQTARAALAGSRDLIGALSALGLRPPPIRAWRATRNRWLTQLSHLPAARSTMRYVLSEDFAAP